MGDGIPADGRHGRHRRHARHHLERDPGRRQRPASSPPRPNTNGSPPFRRTTLEALPAELDEQLVQLRLATSSRGITSASAGASSTSSARDEHVVDERVAAAEGRGRAGDQARDRRGRRRRGRPVTSSPLDELLEVSRAAPRRSRSAPSPGPKGLQLAAASSACSGATSSAIWSRSRFASAGEAPPVETATAIGPARWTAGRMKLQSSGTSATLQSSRAASASRETRSFTARSAVAAITRNAPRRWRDP